MSKIEQLISDIEGYIESCKYQAFSTSKIIVDKDQISELLYQLRLKTPDEVKKYQKILNNKDAILDAAKEEADAILNAAKVHTEELLNEHEIMQRAYAQADELIEQATAQANELIEQSTAQAQSILDNATEDANNIRMSAVQYTDEMLAQLQYIIEHSIRDNKEKYTSLITDLEEVLSVVNNNRKELSGVDDDVVTESEPQPQAEAPVASEEANEE